MSSPSTADGVASARSCTLPSPSPSAVRPLTLLTYNVHNGFIDPTSSTCAFAPIVDWLSVVDADVICFQEVTWTRVSRRHFHETLRDQLGFAHIAYGNAADLYGNGFYGQVTASKTPFAAEPVTLPLKDTKHGEERAALFTQHQSGLSIINVHLDVWDRSGEVRVRQLHQIKSLIRQLRSPVLLCGDFNSVRRCDYSQEEWDVICRLHHIETASLDVVGEMGGRDVFDLLDKRLNRTHVKISKRIDFLFVIEQGMGKVSVRDARRYDVLWSDHYPLWAALEIATPDSGLCDASAATI